MIKHNQPFFDHKERLAVKKILSLGLVSQGLEVSKFETDLCNFFKLPKGHAVVVSSGSAALFLALWSLNGKNKRVGFPVYSCAALRNAAGMLGSKKVFLDCDKDSANLNIENISQKDIEILDERV